MKLIESLFDFMQLCRTTNRFIYGRFMTNKLIYLQVRYKRQSASLKADNASLLCKFFDIVIQHTSNVNSIDLNPKKCSYLESKRGLAAAKPTCSLLAKHAQIFRQLSARITMNSFVKFDRRSHHFIGPLIRIDPLKSSVRLNERVPLLGGLKNPILLIHI